MDSFPGVDKDHADVKNLSDMASILQENNRAIDEIRKNMIELAKQSPYFQIVNSFYGIGEVLEAMSITSSTLSNYKSLTDNWLSKLGF